MAGVVEMPGDEEFITQFLGNKQGATGGLLYLGLFDALVGKKEKAERTLLTYRYVKRKLAGVNLQYLLPDILHWEHLLCKIKRVIDQARFFYDFPLAALAPGV